jgi:2-oxoglutarate ferredoxin oxidoreductase subunit beta
MNKMGRGLDTLHEYQEKSVVRDGADTKDVAIEADGPIVVGKFVDIDRPTFYDQCRLVIERAQPKAE